MVGGFNKTPVKSSIVRCLSNAVVKVLRNCELRKNS